MNAKVFVFADVAFSILGVELQQAQIHSRVRCQKNFTSHQKQFMCASELVQLDIDNVMVTLFGI